MAKFDKARFNSEYPALVGWKAKAFLHENSKELLQILIDNKVKVNGNVFELGAGPGRNLHYIKEHFTDCNIYASDQYKDLKNASELVRKEIKFYEADSIDMIKEPIKDTQLFISSDHLMHLRYDKADSIIKTILSDWNPEYILLREIKKEFETPEHPRLFHNYEQFFTKYNKVFEKTSDQAEEYFIWLLKRK